MRVAIVENTAATPLGQVGVALKEAGAHWVTYRPYLDGNLPRNPAEHDALIVMGGEQAATDDATHPYLPELAALMRSYGAADKAVLGICLGAQILARAHGATNLLGTAHEFGWHRVTATDAGRDDPVFAAAAASFPIFEWHRDSFTLPEGARLLARSDAVAHQAYRIGRASYGMQFHFEMSRPVVRDMVAIFPKVIEAAEPGWLQRHAEEEARHGAAADAAGLALARAWIAQI